MKKMLHSKKESEAELLNKKRKTPRQALRIAIKAVGRVDQKQVDAALEPLLLEWVRQERASGEQQHG